MTVRKEHDPYSFVPDRKFKTLMDDDYQELGRCIDSGCYKSVIVLAGSLIECLSLFCLQHLNKWPSSKGDILKADLASLIDQLVQENILSNKAKDLSSVVRYYRNLIHPGRLMRLDEKADKDSAEIAASLVNLITAELAKAFLKQYGLTADQMIEKLKIDSSAAIISHHHLKRISGAEAARLVSEIIPKELGRLESENWISDEEADWIQRYRSALCSVFFVACKQKQGGPTEAFSIFYVETLRNGSAAFISLVDKFLFDGVFLLSMAKDDYDMVVDHWIGKLTPTAIVVYDRGVRSVMKHLETKNLAAFYIKLANMHERTKEKKGKDTFYEILSWNIPDEQNSKDALLSEIKKSIYYKIRKAFFDELFGDDNIPF